MEAKPTTTEKMVKILLRRPIMINRKEDKHGVVRGDIVEPSHEPVKDKDGKIVDWKLNKIVEVSESDAKLFCDTNFDGHYAFGGERYGKDGQQKHDYRRAVRV
jgi:hypothetical protein